MGDRKEQILFDPRKTSNPLVTTNTSGLNSQALAILVPLIAAAGLDEELLKILTPSNINMRDSDGDTPLNYSIFTGKVSTVRLLLSKGAKHDSHNNKGAYPVHLAIGNDRKNEETSKEILKCLKDVHADLNVKEQNGTKRTPLHIAAENDLENIFYFLYNFCECSIELNGNNKFPHEVAPSNGKVKLLWTRIYEGEVENLFSAVNSESVDKIKRILNKKVVSNISKNRRGQTVLHYAITQGLVTAALFLLRYGTDEDKLNILQTTNGDGMFPLHEACMLGHLKIAKEIVMMKNVTNVIQRKDNASNTALHFAIKHNQEEIAILLVQNGAPLDARNEKGETPRSLASESLRRKLTNPNKQEPSPRKPIPNPKTIPEPGPSSPPRGPSSILTESNNEFRVINMSEIQKTLDEKKNWKIIGRSSYSSVYLGIYKNTQVAVKHLPYSLPDNFEDSDNFKMITNTKVEHINCIYGYIKHENSVYIVTAYAANGNLMEYILKNGSSIPFKRKLDFAQTIAEAVMRLHGFKIVHRDLQTSSFLVSFDYQLKLTDLRVALIIRSTGGKAKNSCSSRYTAPELLGEEVDKEAYFKGDIFSIGIILWEVFANQEAFKGKGEFSIMSSIKNNQRPQLSEIQNSKIQSIIEGCWKPNPNDRPEAISLFNLLMQV